MTEIFRFPFELLQSAAVMENEITRKELLPYPDLVHRESFLSTSAEMKQDRVRRILSSTDVAVMITSLTFVLLAAICLDSISELCKGMSVAFYRHSVRN